MKKYEKVMDHIQVTEEMRSRLINHIQASLSNVPKRKRIRFPNYKRYIPVAASFVVLIVGAVLFSQLFSPSEPITSNPPPNLQIGFQVVPVASAKELEKKVGFTIPDLSELPFSVEAISYTAYGTELAEITYEGQGKTAVLRKSIQNGNNSGIFDLYEITEPIPSQEISGTLSGHSKDSLVLAVWQGGKAAYSIFLSDGVGQAEWGLILGSITE